MWLIVIPLIALLALEGLVPALPHPRSHDPASLLGSDSGHELLHGAWGWFGVSVVLALFNTFLGEELLLRGFLLPRMSGAFGRGDWAVNGLLFAAYHLHMPWVIPVSLLDGLILSSPTKRYRSAWIGIAVHSAQSALVVILALMLVL